MTERLQQFALIALCALPVWLILRQPRRRPWPREVALGCFVMFMSALIVMALEGSWTSPTEMIRTAMERIREGTGLHFTPFDTVKTQLESISTIDSRIQLLGNTLLFIPWGFFLPLLWRRFRHPVRIALMCLGLTCLIEFIQLFINRTVDVDDVILNFVGSMTGAGLWWCIHHFFPATDLLLTTSDPRQRS